jgi:hypothetical protein
VSTCQLKICFNVYCLRFVELLAVRTTLYEIVIKVTTTKYFLKGMGEAISKSKDRNDADDKLGLKHYIEKT